MQLAALAARLLGNTGAGRKLGAQVALGEAMLAMHRGVPHGRFLAGAYWRRLGGLPATFPAGANPARDQCGMLWVSPILPMRGADVVALHALAEPLFKRHGFDLFVTFSMINERALGAALTITYDKQDAGETARAHACYHAVFEAVMAAGYIPYRVGTQSMQALDPQHDTYWKTVARIRQALDPAGLMVPGRYQPEWRSAGAQPDATVVPRAAAPSFLITGKRAGGWRRRAAQRARWTPALFPAPGGRPPGHRSGPAHCPDGNVFHRPGGQV